MKAEVKFGDDRIDLGDLKAALRGVADTRSIAQAAQNLGVTYRTLWGRLVEFDRVLGGKLVAKGRGRGTQLTGKGRALLAVLERHDDLFSLPNAERVNVLTGDFARSLRDQPLLRLLASHDYAISRVFETDATVTSVSPIGRSIHLSSAGSVECVRALLRGDVDLAGYHHVTAVPATTEPVSMASTLWTRMEQSADFWSVAIMDREQGLIVSPALKSQVKALADVTRPGLRFINRQRGSGTRLLLDGLITEAGLVASSISGYEREEFTHQAVAAMVAAGAADVGPGLRTAAAQFKLHFVPLATETYRIAGRIETRRHPAVLKLLATLRIEAARLPGYTVLSAAR